MKRLCLILSLLLMVSGCVSYYKVTDLATDTEYYTNSYAQKSSGAVTFKDSRSDSHVTLQSSKITKVSKEEFRYGSSEE